MPLGAHVSASGGLATAVERAQAIGAECLQLFLCAPQRWLAPKHADEQVARFAASVREAGIGPNFAHAIYLINLASPDAELRARSVEALRCCVEWADRCGLEGVIVHIGSAKGQPVDEAERTIAASVQEVLDAGGVARVLLENSAGAGTTVGARFSQIGELVAALDHHPRLGLCLDTAHAFASGYDLRTVEGLDQAIAEIDRTVGLERLAAIHANDSKAGLGSALDRHENIGHGQIGEEPFARMLRHPALTDRPWLLEVPGFAKQGPDLESMQTLKRLAGR